MGQPPPSTQPRPAALTRARARGRGPGPLWAQHRTGLRHRSSSFSALLWCHHDAFWHALLQYAAFLPPAQRTQAFSSPQCQHILARVSRSPDDVLLAIRQPPRLCRLDPRRRKVLLIAAPSSFGLGGRQRLDARGAASGELALLPAVRDAHHAQCNAARNSALRSAGRLGTMAISAAFFASRDHGAVATV